MRPRDTSINRHLYEWRASQVNRNMKTLIDPDTGNCRGQSIVGAVRLVSGQCRSQGWNLGGAARYSRIPRGSSQQSAVSQNAIHRRDYFCTKINTVRTVQSSDPAHVSGYPSEALFSSHQVIPHVAASPTVDR